MAVMAWPCRVVAHMGGSRSLPLLRDSRASFQICASCIELENEMGERRRERWARALEAWLRWPAWRNPHRSARK